jgi:gliding motility-associated-like protein
MTKKLIVGFAALLLSFTSSGQIIVQNTMTPDQLVQNVLLGFGVTASNITVNGSPANSLITQGNATFFDDNGTTFPIPTGVLLSTGNGIGAIGPNSSGSYTDNNPATPNVSTDPHLSAIASASPTNGIVLEFDFVPAGDTISFNYLFGSDEYPEFSPSTFNDAFGFFLWGPGIAGPYALAGYPAGGENLAIIPGTTTPVTINNVGPSSNVAYYVDNLGGAAYGTAIQYDGTTTLLSANATVQCGQTYHIKLAISNVGDQSYDSGVFLQANSFSSEAIQVAVATVSGDTSIYEGCSTADLSFIRPQTQLGDTLIINYDISGTAIDGTDYLPLANPIMFLPGEDTITLTIDPIADGFPDNTESVTITAITISQCGDTIISSGTIWILDSMVFDIIETDTLVQCYNDSILVSAIVNDPSNLLFPPFTYAWEGGQTGTSAYFPTTAPMTGSVDYLVTVTNSCGYTGVDTVTIDLNQTLVIDSLIQNPTSSCNQDGWVSAYVSGETNNNGQSYYHWDDQANWDDFGTGSFIDGTAWQNLGSGWYFFTVADDVCSAIDSVFVEMENPPQAVASATPDNGCDPVGVTLSNDSQNASTYYWDFGNGANLNTNNTNSQSQVYSQSTIVMLVASEGPCADTAYVNISVTACGCTDPTADNYDPNATFDDGSCTYPVPTVVAPNVFTPNGDGDNDVYFLETTNAVSIEFVILNRWGNVMFEQVFDPSLGALIGWNGTTPLGIEAGEGTYYYKYVAKGVNGDEIDGHGFLQLVRD